MGWGKGARRDARGRLSAAFRNNTAILRWLLCAELTLVGGPALAGGALPTGGQYVAGQGTIAGSANAITVNQSTNHGIINWQGFSIGAGNRVQFNNGTGATLNRVTGNNLSRIDGSLSATGSVYLINPQGVVIGPGGKVVTNGSFVASTRDVSNSDFMGGAAFAARGTSNGSVVNAGTITSANGDAILVGRTVKNTGTISAPNGTAVMAAGNEILLQPVGSDSRIAVSGGTGDVTNSGTVKAAQAALASAGGNVYALVENNGGINATGTKTIDGHVWLTAGGTAQVSGNITATNADGSGGTVTVRAQNINVTGTVDASAAKPRKNGGTVSIVATGDTAVSGVVKAKGNASGKGGIVETSGHTLEIGGATVDAGEGGQWLLDPYDLTVDASAAATIDSSLGAGTDVTLQTTASGASGPGIANSSGNGDILVESALSWNSAATLTLDAYRSIAIDANVTVAGGGGVVLKTNDGGTGGDYSFGDGASLSFTAGAASGASLEINGASYTLLYGMGDVQNINASDAALQGNYALATSLDATAVTGWIPLGTDGAGTISNVQDGFSGVFDGLGHTISGLTVDIGSNKYAGLFGYNTGVLRDIGLIGGSTTGLDDVGGLVGYSREGSIANVYATGTVSGNDTVGGLVGQNGAAITNAYATGTVSGHNSVGGLAGQNNFTITNAYATGTVSGDSSIGGLVGTDGGALSEVENAYATGSVSGTESVGGLVGSLGHGNITNVYATGSVTGQNDVGGLAGANSGAINASYATGAVSGSTNVGGFAGANSGTITGSYWDTDTSGTTTGIGSLVSDRSATGLTTSELTTSLPSGLSTSAWGNADNQSTPYLLALTNNMQPGYIGDGSGGQFSLIFTLDQLQAVNNDLSANYALANSLDASGVTWTPIGNSSTRFTGTLDGLDHVVSNLTINTTSAYVGLFGVSSGTIRNIGVAGGSVSSSSLFVGDLVGRNFGTIVDAWATGAVHGNVYVGGLVGWNDSTGAISNSYASGAVTASSSNAGGLVGENAGSISNSFATGAVDGAGAGGLVGFNNGGAITASYATGVVTGGSIGGLAGLNDGTITSSYWDTDTSGVLVSDGGTGLTTAKLQTALPTGFSSSTWGTGTGLYPYFLWQYPTTPQAVSGKAYSDTGVTPLQGGTVTTLVDGVSLGSVTTGANGYYYFLEPSGTISSGSAVLAYTSVGARVDAPDASVSDFDIWGNTLIAPTDATAYSGIDTVTPLQAQDATLIAQAIGSNSDPTAGLTNYGYIASGDFTIDQALTVSNGLYIKSTGGITVADALTLQGTNGLTLNASGALTVDAPISITGAGHVALNAGTDTSTLPGLSLVELSFAPGDSIDYGGTDNGGTLSINGAAYTLLYTMGGLQNINTALSNNYALATSLDAATDVTTPATWLPIGINSAGTVQNSGNGFNGTFDGLGHTVSNLSVHSGSFYAGLFGYVHGKIRNVGLVGGSVTSSNQYAGGLVGELYNGLLYNAYSSANVTASGTAGSLIGLNSGYVVRTYATGSVHTSGSYAGGLAGQSSNQIVDSFATGSVTGSTGKAGGLVGYNSGLISNAYATGSVTGSDKVGGLVGWNGGSVSNAYATGYVHGASNVGGVAGNNFGTITNGYWDTETTGQNTSTAGTGLTTAELQSTLPSGFDSSVWGTGSGLYPYFLWQYATTPEAVSGIAYGDRGITPLQAGTVTALVDGASLGSVSTGANGYYYFLEPSGTISSGSAVIASTSSGARVDMLNGTASGFDIWGGNTLIAPTSATTYSGIDTITPLQTQDASLIAQAIGSNPDPTTGLTNYGYIASGDFTIDTSADLSNGLYIKGDANIAVAAALTLSGTNNLTLDASDVLTIDAPVSVTGAGSVNLGYDASDPTNLSFGLTVAGFTGGIDYGATDNGGKLSINGASYALLYDMNEVQAINASDAALGGNYALATSLDASGVSNWTPVGNDSQEFDGIFEGLGHSIANLTVNVGSGTEAGLFGWSGGTIRDVGLDGGSITGGGETGSLLGVNYGGVVSYAWSSASVTSSVDQDDVGGLVGYNDSTIVNSFATGNVAGTGADDNVGGLVGTDFVGTISQSFATGAVTGGAGSSAGGLVGFGEFATLVDDYAMGSVTAAGVDGGGSGPVAGGLMGFGFVTNIDQSYAIGAVRVSGTNSSAGGLIGQNLSGTTTNSYWDTETSGLSTSDGGTGLTTRLLQGSVSFSDGGAFDLAVWSAQEGLFPYLASFFPNGAMALTGIAYGDGGATPLQGGAVTGLVDGVSLGTVSTGANGYYYFLEPSGAIASGSAVLAYTNNGARVDTADDALDGNGNESGFDIWGNTLIAPTITTSYSNANATSLQTQDAALITQAVGSNTDPTTGLSHYGYIASGDFTIDTSADLSNGLYVKSAGDITIADALTLPGANGLTLDAAGTLSINAPVTVSGAGKVVLSADVQPIGCGCTTVLDLSFGLGADIDFGSVDNGATLAINGDAYALLYSMADLAAINTNSGLQGNYALATSLDASGTSDWVPLGTDGAGGVLNFDDGFSGIFEGLGNQISNLTIDMSGSAPTGVGLFGFSSGELRDVGITQSSVQGSVNSTVGLLVGTSEGLIDNAYATGDVAITGGGGAAGGLVGYNGGDIVLSHADGNVTTISGGSFSPQDLAAGGLVGYNDGGIFESYASAAVAGGDVSSLGGLAGYSDDEIVQSYATGAVTGGDHSAVGGLAGYNDNGYVSESYATGRATGGDGAAVGGLVGYSDNGDIEQSYATGNVSVVQSSLDVAFAGGLVGNNDGGLVVLSYATGNVSGSYDVGGLVGENERGLIYQSFAMGNATGNGEGTWVGGLVGENDGGIEQSFATGSVIGDVGDAAGGLVGGNTGSIDQTYAMGAVRVGASDPVNNDPASAGGLVGYNDGGIAESYSTGMVSGDPSAALGGLVGRNDTVGAISDAYWDTETSGFAAGVGEDDGSGSSVTGLATADLQNNDALAGFDFAGTWGTSEGLYPYFLWQYSSAPQAISGTVFTGIDGTTPLVGATVDAISGGVLAGTGASGANGYYYVLPLPGSVNGASILTYLAGNAVKGATFTDDLTDALDPGFQQLGAENIYGGTTYVWTQDTNLSIALGNLGTTLGTISNSDLGLTATASSLEADAGGITVAHPFGNDLTVDGSLTASGDINILGWGGNITLAAGTSLSSAASGDAIQIYGGNFINNAGSSPLILTGGGRWLIYSDNPTDDVFGDLDSGNTAVWGASYSTLPLPAGSVTQSGNRYLFAYQPTLTITTTNLTKTYGDDVTTDVANAYTVSGFEAGVANAFLGDDATSVYSGAPSVTSSGSLGAANVSSGPYEIDASLGGMTFLNGYAVNFVDAGKLTVNKASLTVTANNDGKTYDGLAYSGGGVSYVGFVNGEGASTLSGTLTYGGTAQGAINAGSYTITASGLTSGNYVISYAPGTLTVAARPITVTADDLNRLYGAANPTLIYAVGGDGLVNGDTLSGSLGTAAKAASGVGNYAIAQGTLAASANYALTFVPGTLTINPASLSITANDVTAATLSAAQFSASYAGFVNGDDSSVVSGLEYGVFPITGDPLDYDIVPFGAKASNYTITFFPGELTLLPQQSGVFPAPLIGDGGYNSSSTFGLTFGTNSFAFSNVATASLGTGDEVLLFETGLPGTISPFEPVVISDYSNATNSEDQLVNCQSDNGQGTCGANGGTGL